MFDGLQLDTRRHAPIYRHLNEGCWPYRYADLRRAVDLHNHILQRYAVAHGLPFVDVAAEFPPDQDLFFDAVHLNDDGTRLHAWIVFRALLPLVRVENRIGRVAATRSGAADETSVDQRRRALHRVVPDPTDVARYAMRGVAHGAGSRRPAPTGAPPAVHERHEASQCECGDDRTEP